MICINLGARTQEEKAREESREGTQPLTKKRIINKKDQKGVQNPDVHLLWQDSISETF